jgi:pimeloyl-ACP methyl ester carboxylesterase
MRFTGVDDVTLVADAYGDPADPPVVLLHGGGQTRHAWGNTARQLGEQGWYALTVDLRGHGDSDWSPDGVYSLERFAGDVRAVSAALASRPALVGASLGGMASLLAIGEGDAPVATALVLVDVAPQVEAAGVERIRAFMRQGLDGFPDLESAADAIASYNPHRPRPTDLSGLTKNLRQRDDGRWYWHWDPRFMALQEQPEGGIDGVPSARMVPQERLEDAARNLRVPTLLVRGASSDLLSEEGAAHMMRLVPHAEQVDVAGAGHMVAGDRNDRFNAAVTEFLEREVRLRAAG